MKSLQAILGFLERNKEESFSINSIAKRLKLNYRIAFEGIKKLEKDGLVTLKKLGNSNQCHFNYRFNDKTIMMEAMKRESLLKNQDIKVLHNRLSLTKSPFYIFIIFGSYATGKNTKHSDIDICIIADNEEVRKGIMRALGIIPLKMHVLDFSSEQFIAMLKTKDNNVGKEILNHNVILKGAEDFYRMVENAEQ